MAMNDGATRNIERMAVTLKVKIPEPINYLKWKRLRYYYRNINEILIDEADTVFQNELGIKINTISLTSDSYKNEGEINVNRTITNSNYMGGIMLSCKDKISTDIVNVNVIVPNKVVEVTFAGGGKEKAVCRDSDVFSLEQAVSICITKHILGGTKKYNKTIKNALKLYEATLQRKEESIIVEERIKKKKLKRLAYKKRRAEKEREEKINIQKEAYVRAMEEIEHQIKLD